MIPQEKIDHYQRIMQEYATTDRNCILASPKGFASLVRCIEGFWLKAVPEANDEETERFVFNSIWLDRARLGKSGHGIAADAEKTFQMGWNNPSPPSAYPIAIPEEMPQAERDRVARALEKYRASLRTNGGKATAPPSPQPTAQQQTGEFTIDPPEGQAEPVQTAEPVIVQAKPMTFNRPLRSGYMIPEEYALIYYAMSHNMDICLVGDASAGKSLTIEVMCEAQEWNLIQMGKIVDETMLKGFMNPITREFTKSKLIRALEGDPELIKYPGHKVVICFDEGFTNMADYLTTLLPLVGNAVSGYLATEYGVVDRGDAVFVFIDNSTGDGGTTNFISRKPVDMALKSRLFFIQMALSPKVAKMICAEDKDLANFTKWMRGAIGRGKVDRLNLDNRGLHMIQDMKDWESFSDEMLGQILYGAFFKGCPPASVATLLRNVKAKPEELKANRYFMATQKYYEELCKSAGLKTDPDAIKA